MEILNNLQGSGARVDWSPSRYQTLPRKLANCLLLRRGSFCLITLVRWSSDTLSQEESRIRIGGAMKRSDFGKRSQSSSGGGLFGALFGGQSGGQQAPQQVIQSDQDKITPRGSGKIEPTAEGGISIGVTPYGDVVNLPLFERSTLVCGQSGSGNLCPRQ